MLYSWPPRRTQTSRCVDSALTTDTPTPCRPPEKLVVLVGELAAGVQPREDQFHPGQFLLRMLVHRHAAAIVLTCSEPSLNSVTSIRWQ